MDVTEFLDQHHADLSPAQRALVLDAAADARADAADRQAEAARRAAAEERLEALTLANRMGGNPVGELQRFRALCEAADDEVRDLSDRLAKATAKRDRAQESMQAAARQLDEINRAVAARVDVPDLLAGAKQTLQAHREYVAGSRAAWQAAQNATSAPRPFVSRGGVAVRSGEVTCDACLAVNASPEESFLIHHTDADGNPLAASPEPATVPPDDSERRSAAGYGREVSR